MREPVSLLSPACEWVAHDFEVLLLTLAPLGGGAKGLPVVFRK